MAPGSGAPAARTILARECAASALWTAAVLSVLGATHAAALHDASPSAAFPRVAAAAAAVGVRPPALAVPPFGLFLSALLPLMVLWEGLGLGLGATMNPAIAVAATVAGQVRQDGVAIGEGGVRTRED